MLYIYATAIIVDKKLLKRNHGYIMCLILNNSVVNSPLITITRYLLYLNGYLLYIVYVKNRILYLVDNGDKSIRSYIKQYDSIWYDYKHLMFDMWRYLTIHDWCNWAILWITKFKGRNDSKKNVRVCLNWPHLQSYFLVVKVVLSLWTHFLWKNIFIIYRIGDMLT